MCGIAGLVERRPFDRSALMQTVRAMTDTLRHRGPDGGDIWTDPEAGATLGHRRLAIIDLSNAGLQPMQSANGHFVVTYNGEIYNYLELRAELAARGVTFRGSSDTEVMLEGFVHWGVRETLAKLVGMFAAALWNRQTRTLWLMRDHVGIKPMYYAADSNRLLFGSELKALRAAADWKPSLDRDALIAYLRHGYVPAPHTIYAEAKKLPPGHLLEWREGSKPHIEAYWSARKVARSGRTHWASAPSEPEAVEQLDTILRDAVKRQMIADVPLGAFLSGGVDSSTVVALMQAQSARPVKTFTVGFDESTYNEAKHAKAVATHLGTDHTELYVQPSHALDVIPRLSDWYDEPFADSSQIPTFFVSEMTRQHVTVALSGDGGDENFAGYNRYVLADRFWSKISRTPVPLRRLAAALLTLPGPRLYDAVFSLFPASRRINRPAEKAAKAAKVLRLGSLDALYRQLVSQWPDPAELVTGGTEASTALWDDTIAADVPNSVARMQLLDTLTYLPDDILTKVDRATMAVGLEARVPLLDHRVVEHAWRLPPSMKLRNGDGKWILRQVLERYVPRSLTERPKMGFGVPIGEWLRGSLRDWAEDLLNPKAIAADDLLNAPAISTAWNMHKAGRIDLHYQLWIVLMLRDWQRHWKI